jgi:hypothetical protein
MAAAEDATGRASPSTELTVPSCVPAPPGGQRPEPGTRGRGMDHADELEPHAAALNGQVHFGGREYPAPRVVPG